MGGALARPRGLAARCVRVPVRAALRRGRASRTATPPSGSRRTDRRPAPRCRSSSSTAANPAAYAALCRFVLDLDLVTQFTKDGPVDDPLRHLVEDFRLIKTELTDGTYLRLVDVRAGLEARTYAAELDVVIGVRDPMLPANDGAIRLQAGAGRGDHLEIPPQAGSQPRRPRPRGDLSRQRSPRRMAAAGLVEERTRGSVAAVTAAFSPARSPVLRGLLLTAGPFSGATGGLPARNSRPGQAVGPE